MTTLLFLFLMALGFALLLTPAATWVGVRLGAVDVPMERKVHKMPIPRLGGLALMLAFVATMALTNLFITDVSALFTFDHRTAFCFYGALVVFGCGLWDDFRRLNPWVKLLFQIAGASLAFAGGVSIDKAYLGIDVLEFGIFSYGITIFWFLLFINAVNLIDGLDGLAGGVVLFTCLLMVVLSVMAENYLNAMYFAVLGGAVMGFLRYNFNPASIFLGDGGSYFLGYVVAALSILGSVKSQVGALMLIPLLALGVPVFDTILSPLRRWVKGRKIFQPDKGHIHHWLLSRGLSSRNAVLILYGLTLALCILAILIVNLRNEMIGLILVIMGAGVLILMRKTGYLGYLALDKFYGWIHDITDVAGFSHERRTFLAVQIEVDKSRTLQEMWRQIGDALEMLKFDRAELHLKANGENFASFPSLTAVPDTLRQSQGTKPESCAGPERRKSAESNPQPSKSTEIFRDVLYRPDETVWIWTRGHYRRETDVIGDGILKVDLPLNANGVRLLLMKDLRRDPLNYYTLRRLEHLRRTLLSNLSRLQSTPKK